MSFYNSNEFLHSAGVSRHMQATGETPSQKTSMKRRSCEVPLGEISSNTFKVSLGDLNDPSTDYDCRSLRSIKSEDCRSLRYYRPIDSRSVKNFRSSLVDVSGISGSTFTLSRPPSYDQLSRRSIIEGNEGQGITSSIEGVLWSDEEENEYFYHENITSAWNQDIECSKRWGYVRDYYIRRKTKPTGTVGEVVQRRAELLTFLDGVPTAKKGNVTVYIKEESEDPVGENSNEIPEETEPYETEWYYDENNDCKDQLDINCDSNSAQNSSKAKESDEKILKEQLKPPKRRNSSQDESDSDENDLFFRSMAKTVKKLPRYEQAQLRLQIGSLVCNTELRCIKNKTSSSQNGD